MVTVTAAPSLQDDPEDLNFRKGDMMTVLRKDEDDWWYARHSDGRVGSIPVPYVEVVSEGGGARLHGTSPSLHLSVVYLMCVCVCVCVRVCVQVEDSQGEAHRVQRARAIMDRQCPYDPSALSFKVRAVCCTLRHAEGGSGKSRPFHLACWGNTI